MTRLVTQMERGSEILSRAALAPGDVAQWRAQTKVFLEDTLGSLHEYAHRYEMAIIGEERGNVEAACGVLKAVWEDATHGHLKFGGN